MCYHHNKPYILRGYLQPGNQRDAALARETSCLGTSVGWKAHGNVIKCFFDNGTNRLIIEEVRKRRVACWSIRNQLKPTAAEAGSSFTGYEEGVVPVRSRGGCVERGCW